MEGLDKTNKHKKRNKVLSVIVLINAVIMIALGEIENTSWILMFINTTSLFTILTFAMPMSELLIEKLTNKEKLVILVRAVILILMISSLYIIFLSKEYKVYWAYWLFIATLIVFIIDRLIQRCREFRKELLADKGKGIWKIAGSILVALLNLMLLSYWIFRIYTPIEIINIGELKVPDSIGITQIYKDKSKATHRSILNTPVFEEVASIRDTYIINKISNSISSNTVENVRNFDELNYDRIRDQNEYYFDLKPKYNSDEPISDKSINEGYVYDIIVFPNGHLFVRQIDGKYDMFEKYKVEISKEQIDEIIKDIENEIDN